MDKKTIIAWIIFVLVVAAGIWYYMTMKPEMQQPVDVSETAGEAPLVTEADFVGIWAMDNGTTYTTREFRADGTIEDRFDGNRDGMIDGSVTGTWEIMTPADLDAVTLPVMDAVGTVVRVQFPEEAFYMLVSAREDGSALSFIYYGQNDTYVYNRI